MVVSKALVGINFAASNVLHDFGVPQVRASNTLEVPVIVTEQYPKALGATVPELKQVLAPGSPIVPKTNFSMYVPEVEQFLINHATKQVGIHVRSVRRFFHHHQLHTQLIIWMTSRGRIAVVYWLVHSRFCKAYVRL